MPYLDTNSRTVKPTANEQFQGLGRMPAYFGVFVGWVKRADDVQKNGRLLVWIPELGSTPDEEQSWITVSYCSPFAGATNVETISKSNLKDFDGTQTSYGLWMVPPDVGNQVLVMFIAGDPARGVWIGSLYDQFMNNMVPAMAADTKNYQYPGRPVPVAEYNKWDTKLVDPNVAVKPYQKTKFQGLGNQGLLRDTKRGITTTSARREAPSAVYGILTPGPVINQTAPASKIRRKGGSSLIMDDGNCSEYVELSTKSGAKLRLDETNGFVYVINRDGTSWIQMDQFGNVDVFSANNISLRAQRDFNIRADRNINFEAGQNIFMKAAKDTKESTTTFTYDVNNHPDKRTIPLWEYVGEGKGTGGNIVMHALWNWQSTTKNNAFLSVSDNNMDIQVGSNFLLTTKDGGQNFSSKLGIKMTTDAAYDLAARGNIRIGSNGTLNVLSDSDMALCTSSSLSASSATETSIASAGEINIDGTAVNIDTDVRLRTLNASTIKANVTDTGAINSRTRARHKRPLGTGTPSSPATPSSFSVIIPQAPLSADPARPAEVKPLNEKINILATWEDPDSKFKRNSQNVFTTVSRYVTYEPCPEHTDFSSSSISANLPTLTQADQTYDGSAGSGNTPKDSPPASVVPGSNNTDVTGDPAQDSFISSDFNSTAFACQLKKHEGFKQTVYKDGNATSVGYGHLLRKNEAEIYPLGTSVPMSQINTWFEQDMATSVKIAQKLCSSWNDLSDVRKRALADMAYNLGEPRLSKFTKFLEAMNKGDFITAAKELKESKWYTQVGLRGNNIITMISQSVDPTGCDKSTLG